MKPLVLCQLGKDLYIYVYPIYIYSQVHSYFFLDSIFPASVIYSEDHRRWCMSQLKSLLDMQATALSFHCSPGPITLLKTHWGIQLTLKKKIQSYKSYHVTCQTSYATFIMLSPSIHICSSFPCVWLSGGTPGNSKGL